MCGVYVCASGTDRRVMLRDVYLQIMPQLLHYLNVDENTSLRTLQPLPTVNGVVQSPDGKAGPADPTAVQAPLSNSFVNHTHEVCLCEFIT